MRSSSVAAVVALVALLSGGVATSPAGAQSDMDDGGFRTHDRPDDDQPADGRDMLDGQDFQDDERVPDDIRRHDFQPNQHRHPTTLDDGFRHDGRRVDPLPPSQQPPPMQPYWGTMRPYWKPIDPSVTKRQGAGSKRHR